MKKLAAVTTFPLYSLDSVSLHTTVMCITAEKYHPTSADAGEQTTVQAKGASFTARSHLDHNRYHTLGGDTVIPPPLVRNTAETENHDKKKKEKNPPR